MLGVLAHHLGHLRGGYLGVDAFFVLSGFLITSILVDEWTADGRIDLARFWMRRTKRLLPALLVVLATVVVVERWFVDGTSRVTLRNESLATLGYVFNWYSIAADVDYWATFATPSPLRHMWSLAIEEQFYLVWPVIVVGLGWWCRRRATGLDRRLGIVAIVGTMVSIVVAQLVWSKTDVLRVYYGTDTRIAAISMGAAAAVFVRRFGLDRAAMPHRRRASAWGLVLVLPIGWAWVTLDGTDDLLYRGGLVATGLFTVGVVVLTYLAPGTALDRTLALRPLRWVGRLSYGLYLWHWPVIVWLTPERTGLDGFILLVIRLLVSFAATIVSYRLVEQPIRSMRTSGRTTAAVAIPAVLGLAVAVAGITAGGATGMAPSRPEAGTRSTMPIPLPSTTVTSTTVTSTTGPPPPNDTSTVVTSTVVTSTVEEPPGPTRLMVVGDSGAYFLGELLLSAAEGGDVVVLPRGMIGCGVVNLGGGMMSDLGFLPDPAGCERWPDQWSDDAEVFEPTDVLLILSWPGVGDRELDGAMRHPCDPVFDAHHRDRLALAIEVAGSSGADVWLATSPDLASAPSGDVSIERVACVNQSIRRSVARADVEGPTAGRVHLLDLRGWVCPADVCLTEIDGDVLRPDDLHFEGPGGLRAAAWILSQLT